MPTFAYSGRTRTGQTVTGERVAETIDAAVAALRREQILVTRIDPAKAEKAAAKAKPKKGAAAPSKNLAIFTRQFSVMIDAGLPLVQCLDILGKQEPHKGFSDVILQVRSDVESGAALADAMKKHPQDVRPALLQHDRRRRGGRYPRHHPQAARGLHREERQAEGAGQVGDDLPDRGHRASRRSWSRRSCGRSSRPSRSCSPASARSCRCRPASSSALSDNLVAYGPLIVIALGADRLRRCKRYYATDERALRDRRAAC